MSEFVTGANLTAKIREVLAAGAPANMAVAFWGKGSTKLLGLPKALKHIQIICDLRSGSCNPDELIDLINRGARIWTLNGLHAKVYLSSGMAVVGSANASANGLAEEGAEIDYSLEAGIFTSDTKIIKTAASWFEQRLDEAELVDKELVEEFRPNWDANRRDIPPRGKSLLKTLDHKPELFEHRNITVLAYEYTELTPKEVTIAEKIGPLVLGASYKSYRDSGDWPFYIDRLGTMDSAPGHWYLDYTVSGKPGKYRVHFTGAWQVLPDKDDWMYPLSPKGKGKLIFMRKRMKRVSGFNFPAEERKELAQRITTYLNSHEQKLTKNECFIESELYRLPDVLNRTAAVSVQKN